MINLRRIHAATLVAAAVALAAPGLARSQALNFTPVKSIYADLKEVALKHPEGVACSQAGSVVVADTGNARLVFYAMHEGVITGGTEVKLAQLTYPTSLQLDSKGNVVALDRKMKRLVRLDPKGAFTGYVELKGPGAAGAVPAAFKLDAADNLYVLDLVGAKVLATDPAGSVTRAVSLPRDGALFTDIAVDAAGTLYAIDAVGATLWSAPKAATAFTALSKSMKDRMNFPISMTSDGHGKLLVVDQNGNGIAVLGVDGSYQGRQLSIGWGEGFVYYPSQLCLNNSGDVLLADRHNNRVQLFTTPH